MYRHDPSSFRNKCSNIALTITFFFCGMPLLCETPQKVAIRLINAKNGKPVSGQHVTVVFDDDLFGTKVLPLSDQNGRTEIEIPSKAKFMGLLAGPKVGKEPYRIAYLVCGRYEQLSLAEILRTGFSAENQCNKKINPQPYVGEVIYFIELIPWWQPDFQ